MILLWGALAGVVAMHVYDPIRDWWLSRRDEVVDGRYPRMCAALRSQVPTVEVPSFHIVMGDVRPFDWADNEGAA